MIQALNCFSVKKLKIIFWVTMSQHHSIARIPIVTRNGNVFSRCARIAPHMLHVVYRKYTY